MAWPRQFVSPYDFYFVFIYPEFSSYLMKKHAEFLT